MLYLGLFCILYVTFLNYVNSGVGTNATSWYVYFTIYSIIGSFVFAGLFNWKYDDLIKAIAIVTVLQSIWCILTFYFDEIKLLNSVLFEIDENENIDFESMKRLRSIGSAGSALSVCLALSSYSYLYFILRGKQILLNTIGLCLAVFATMLAGTTGMIICITSILSALVLSNKSSSYSRKFVILGAMIAIVVGANISFFFDDYQFRHITEKFIDFYESGLESDTFQNLEKQEISGISIETIIGTGISRGQLSGYVRCYHDGGYYRSYFAIGLIMACIFYCVLYRSMYRLSRQVKGKRELFFLLGFILILCIIEYKEPYNFYYFPFFLFNSLVLALKNTKQ